MRYVWIALTTLLVVAALGVPLYLFRDRSGPSPARHPAAERRRLSEEEHYYVFLTVIEVTPEDGEGCSWDTGGPPDLAYEIKWQGQKVFQSSTKDDTLVAKWSNVSLGLGDVIGTVSLDDSIKAARITARRGGVVEFAVYDKDSMSGDDLIGAWSVQVAKLRVGDQTWGRPAGRVVKAQCRVLPLDGVKFETLTR